MPILRLFKSAINALPLFVVFISATCAYAGDMDFNIANGVTSNQTWNLDGGDTGTIEKGGAIDTSMTEAILINGTNNKVDNAGFLKSTTTAIRINGASNMVYNHGVIEGSATGIFIFGDDNIIRNYGPISGGATGIFIDATDNIIHNFGPVSGGATGIFIDAADNIINNYGYVTGGASAIFSNNINNTLNIFPGSQIVGDINFVGAGNVINIFGHDRGAGSSSTLEIMGIPTINQKGTNMVGLGGNVFAVVDPSGPSINGAALGSMTSGIHNVLAGRGGQVQPAQVASTRVEPGMMSSSDDRQIWFSGFGSHRERDTDGGVLAYDHDYYGGVGGYEMALNRSTRIGFMAGYANTDLATDFQSLYTNTHSGFVGTYGQIKFSSFNLDAS